MNPVELPKITVASNPEPQCIWCFVYNLKDNLHLLLCDSTINYIFPQVPIFSVEKG